MNTNGRFAVLVASHLVDGVPQRIEHTFAGHHADEAAGFLCFLGERVEECIQEHGKRPTFIAVDWWEDGDVVEAARLVNLIEVA